MNLIVVDYHKASLLIGLHFIGPDSDATNAVFTEVVEPSAVFQTPQDLSEQYLRANGVYFELLRELLASQAKFERFEPFFRSRYQQWLSNQAHPHGRLKILWHIQPGWGFLSEQSLAGIGQVVARWFWSDEEFAKEAAATIDTPTRTDEVWLKGRDVLRKSIFVHFCNDAQAQS